MSAIHGYVLTAWALAGLVGSGLASYLHQATGSYAAMTKVYSVIFLLATAVSVAMKLFVNRELARKGLAIPSTLLSAEQ